MCPSEAKHGLSGAEPGRADRNPRPKARAHFWSGTEPESRNASTGSRLPFASIGVSSSTSASSPIASRVAAAITTSPGRAAAWSRAAVFVVSPITAKLRWASAPT